MLQHLQKKRAIEKMLDIGMVMLILDARLDGVDLPEHVKESGIVRLNFSWRFKVPMELGLEAVTARLSFSGVPYDVRVPYEAIFACVLSKGGDGFVFHESVPKDTTVQMEPLPDSPGVTSREIPFTATPILEERPKLQVLKGGRA